MSSLLRRLRLVPLLAALLAVGALGSFPTANAQDEQAPETEDASPIEVERLKSWPDVDAKAVKSEVERLRKSRTPEMGQQAQAALITVGAGCAPYLLEKLDKEKDKKAQGRIIAVLEAVTGPPHTRLLAAEFVNKGARVRTWSLERVARFSDAGVRAEAEAAHAKAAKRKKRDYDANEVFAAGLCCASTGSFTGFDDVAGVAEVDWKKRGEVIHAALAPLRSPEATSRIKPWLEEGARKRKLAALRLLAACGDAETATALVAPFLDNTDNTLRVGAINALRGIVDGDAPLDKLPVFEAIERANKWKSRL